MSQQKGGQGYFSAARKDEKKRLQCKGITKEGDQCKNLVDNSSGYCYHHEYQGEPAGSHHPVEGAKQDAKTTKWEQEGQVQNRQDPGRCSADSTVTARNPETQSSSLCCKCTTGQCKRRCQCAKNKRSCTSCRSKNCTHKTQNQTQQSGGSSIKVQSTGGDSVATNAAESAGSHPNAATKSEQNIHVEDHSTGGDSIATVIKQEKIDSCTQDAVPSDQAQQSESSSIKGESTDGDSVAANDKVVTPRDGPPGPGSSFHIVSWNIKGKGNVARRKTVVSATLGKMNLDILCLQENTVQYGTEGFRRRIPITENGHGCVQVKEGSYSLYNQVLYNRSMFCETECFNSALEQAYELMKYEKEMIDWIGKDNRKNEFTHILQPGYEALFKKCFMIFKDFKIFKDFNKELEKLINDIHTQIKTDGYDACRKHYINDTSGTLEVIDCIEKSSNETEDILPPEVMKECIGILYKNEMIMKLINDLHAQIKEHKYDECRKHFFRKDETITKDPKELLRERAAMAFLTINDTSTTLLVISFHSYNPKTGYPNGLNYLLFNLVEKLFWCTPPIPVLICGDFNADITQSNDPMVRELLKNYMVPEYNPRPLREGLGRIDYIILRNTGLSTCKVKAIDMVIPEKIGNESPIEYCKNVSNHSPLVANLEI